MKIRHSDYILIGVLVILVILGVLMIYSVSAPFSQERFGQTFYYLKRQILFGFLPGAILGFFFFKISLTFLRKTILILFLISLGLLVMVFIPNFGVSIGGATRWISLGPISFQPSELLKLTFIIYLAAWLTRDGFFSSKEKGKGQKKLISEKIKFVAFLIIIGLISLFLIFQPDLSTLGLIIFVAILMYFSAKTPILYTILIILIISGSLIALIKLAPYRMERLLVFLNPEIDPMGIGYQLRQALIGVGSGGISGLGLGMSYQKFGFLPHPIADAIFAIFAEETGFIGSLVLVLLFLIFFWRGFEISKKSPSEFSKLVALGISSWIVLQAFLHIGSMIGLLPLTGIPLPFVSYGASHLIIELIGVGILLNISKNT
ncbi:putative lipid II flippase FtsW [Patescibacteria group bacterium]|nr:putative lipid II flippase FtsW [Patescibacteria group bacterium]